MEFPPQVRLELEGWALDWFDLESAAGSSAGLDEAWRAWHETIRGRYASRKLVDEPRVSRIRRLFRQAGCDPTRYRPSSEALVRRVLKGHDLPRIHPLVDLNNLLSMELRAPCCVLDLTDIAPPFVFRAGVPGEQMMSMRGEIDLSGKPLLADAQGSFGTPITDSHRVKVHGATQRCWLVVYLPVDEDEEASSSRSVLERLLEAAPVAQVKGHIRLS